MRFILFLSLPLYALDQLTKQWVMRSINPFDVRDVVPDFFQAALLIGGRGMLVGRSRVRLFNIAQEGSIVQNDVEK